MEVNKRASIKSIPYDEFKDNDTLEKIAQELNEGGANVMVKSFGYADLQLLGLGRNGHIGYKKKILN